MKGSAMNPELPLNEPQERKVTILLARLETALQDLHHAALHPPENSRLNHYGDRIDPTLAGPLARTIAQAQQSLEQMARDLDLQTTQSSIRRTHLAALQLLNIDLYGALPSSGLSGYGPVAPPTAQYLEQNIPKLEAIIKELIQLLEQGRP